jgi:hypothetical protein
VPLPLEIRPQILDDLRMACRVGKLLFGLGRRAGRYRYAEK